jgi:hypothetical protein
MKKILSTIILSTLLIFGLNACNTVPKGALALTQDSMELRQLQTRSFNTTNEKKLLISAAGVLQDLGFTIDESETKLGVIVGSKDRDAMEAGQIAAAVIIAAFSGAIMHVDKDQKIRASIVTRPVGKKTNLRITLQRVVWNTGGQITRREPIEDEEIYQGFFEKLSKAMFLTAHEI